MDTKESRSDTALSERNKDGKYAQGGAALQCNRIKPYQDTGSNSLGKVEAAGARPCAVIGPDRVVPPPASAVYKPSEAWPGADPAYRLPPDYPLKPPDYQPPSRNISPRQTFQENMRRIMVPPTYNANKISEDHNFPVDATLKSNKSNLLNEGKFCDVPYTVNPILNEQKNVRNPEISVSNLEPMRNVPHGWPPVSTNTRPIRPYGAPELYQYPEYPSCAGPRPVTLSRPHRTVHEDGGHLYDPYYSNANLRFKPYPNVKERYPPVRYDYIGNYSNTFHPPPPFPHHKYDLQKPVPHPFPGYPQMPIKYLEARLPEPAINNYQRTPNQQQNFNSIQYRNQVIHPSYGPVPGNCLQNKLYSIPPDGAVKSIPPNKLPYGHNSKFYSDCDILRPKTYPISENFYINEMTRAHHMNGQIMPPNYASINMHPGAPHPYYRKDNPAMKNLDYAPPHFRSIDSMINMNCNPMPRIAPQFSPSAITISPSDSNTSIDTQTQLGLHEDCGYVSQSSTASIRSIDSGINRGTNDMYRRFDHRYNPSLKPTSMSKRERPQMDNMYKDKKEIDVREFLQSWNEGEEEVDNYSKEIIAQPPPHSNKIMKHGDNNQEQLYVLGSVNVPSEELSKYEHLLKVSKLPENIKGYNSLELLNQFEQAISSSNLNSSNSKSSTPKDYQATLKSAIAQHGTSIPPRPLSPLDVEAKISQSVIRKEVGYNFEIKPCSPKMLNVEVAAPVQTLIGERVIEKVSNPYLIQSPSIRDPNIAIDNTCNVIKHQETHRALNDNVKIPSCKMASTSYINNDVSDTIKSNYSLQDLESNSGVCLASLPRLDNDIELNFQEVNQQFINANKAGSVITTTSKELPVLGMNHSDENNSPCPDKPCHMDIESVNDYDKESPKLSKYRKLKRKGSDTTENHSQLSPQTLRTDSVIIKNPDSVKCHEEIEDKLKYCLSDTQVNPMNLTVQPTTSPCNEFNLGDNICQSDDMAIDFSLSSSEYSSVNKYQKDLKNFEDVEKEAHDFYKTKADENRDDSNMQSNSIQVMTDSLPIISKTKDSDNLDDNTNNDQPGYLTTSDILDSNSSGTSIDTQDTLQNINSEISEIGIKQRGCESLDSLREDDLSSDKQFSSDATKPEESSNNDLLDERKFTVANENEGKENTKTHDIQTKSEIENALDEISTNNVSSEANSPSNVEENEPVYNIDTILYSPERLENRTEAFATHTLTYDNFSIVDKFEMDSNPSVTNENIERERIDIRTMVTVNAKAQNIENIESEIQPLPKPVNINNKNQNNKASKQSRKLTFYKELFSSRFQNLMLYAEHSLCSVFDQNNSHEIEMIQQHDHHISQTNSCSFKIESQNSNSSPPYSTKDQSETNLYSNTVDIESILSEEVLNGDNINNNENLLETDSSTTDKIVSDKVNMKNNLHPEQTDCVTQSKDIEMSYIKVQKSPYDEDVPGTLECDMVSESLIKKIDTEEIANMCDNQNVNITDTLQLSESNQSTIPFSDISKGTESSETTNKILNITTRNDQNGECIRPIPNHSKPMIYKSPEDYICAGEIITSGLGLVHNSLSNDLDIHNSAADSDITFSSDELMEEKSSEMLENTKLILKDNSEEITTVLEPNYSIINSCVVEVNPLSANLDGGDLRKCTILNNDNFTENRSNNDINSMFSDKSVKVEHPEVIDKLETTHIKNTKQDHRFQYDNIKYEEVEDTELLNNLKTIDVEDNLHLHDIKNKEIDKQFSHAFPVHNDESAEAECSKTLCNLKTVDVGETLLDSDGNFKSVFQDKNDDDIMNVEHSELFDTLNTVPVDETVKEIPEHINSIFDDESEKVEHNGILNNLETVHVENIGHLEKAGNVEESEIIVKEKINTEDTGLVENTGQKEVIGQVEEIRHIEDEGIGVAEQTNHEGGTIHLEECIEIEEARQVEQAGFVEETGHVKDTENSEETGLLEEAGIVEESGFVDETGLKEETGYEEEVGTLEDTGHVEAANLRDGTGHEEETGLAEKTGLIEQTGLVEETGHEEEAGLVDETGLIEESRYIKEGIHIEETAHDQNTEYAEQNILIEDEHVGGSILVEETLGDIDEKTMDEQQHNIQTDLLGADCILESFPNNKNDYLQPSILPSKRTSLKRSLSDSALSGYQCENSSSQDNDLLWPPKRKRNNENNSDSETSIAKKFCNLIENHRRNSVSSVGNQENVSFCIVIDKDCIITEDEDAQKICIAEISEECLALIPNGDENIESEIQNISFQDENYTNPFVEEHLEESTFEETWIDDVACIETIETIVSDDIAEDIEISAAASPRDEDSSDYDSNNDSNDILSSINEYANKVKCIYGEQMCSDDAQLVDTLYRTPQMNVNKTLRYSQNCSGYYDTESLKNVLSDSKCCDTERFEQIIDKESNSALHPAEICNKAIVDKENHGLCSLDVKTVLIENKRDCLSSISNLENNMEGKQILLDMVHDNTQDDTVHSCESSSDNVFSYNELDKPVKHTISRSPEVSSTTSEERNSSILLKITNYDGSVITELNNINSYSANKMKNTVSCKFTENNDYITNRSHLPHRPLITKAAQKYIPPLKETIGDLKVKLPLPTHSLIKLKQLKVSKEKPKKSSNSNHRSSNNAIKKHVVSPKKPKPKFEDVLKSIDEIQFKMHKEKSKKPKKHIPKVIIKKTENGSHYTSTSHNKFNPDLTGRKWQPWVFIERNYFIDKMAIKKKTRAVFNHRKNTYVYAEKFYKYKSINCTNFVISQPKYDESTGGQLKYTIRLKHNY